MNKIEIHGAGFQNKGAELMLRTVLSELTSRLPGFVPAIDPVYGSYNSRSELGLRQILPPRLHVGMSGFSKRFLRQKLFRTLNIQKYLSLLAGFSLEHYGCVELSEISALVDISGFAFTDQWPIQFTKDFASITDYYRKSGKPIILLPQAFGPFTNNETRKYFQRIVENADLIYARDKLSYSYVEEFCSDTKKLNIAPDITLFYPHFFRGVIPIPHDKYVCVVPNCRMLDQGRDFWGDKYENYLIEMSLFILRQNLSVKILVHDISGLDFLLAKNIIRETMDFRKNVDLVVKENPLEIKEVIGNSLALVGSRYHSLVSSFSQCVPSLAIGWSHKYESLYEDFGCGHLAVSHTDLLESCFFLLDEILNEETNMKLRQKISSKLQTMHQVNQLMWDSVVKLLSHPSNALI